VIDLIRRAYARLLFWKWDRDYYAAVERMCGCAHKHTMFVDVGTVHEKCCDCWALRLPNPFSFPGTMEWVPNSANPRRARQVAPLNTKKEGSA